MNVLVQLLKNALDTKIGIDWNINRNLGKIDILTEFCLPARNIGREHCHWRSNLALSQVWSCVSSDLHTFW